MKDCKIDFCVECGVDVFLEWLIANPGVKWNSKTPEVVRVSSALIARPGECKKYLGFHPSPNAYHANIARMAIKSIQGLADLENLLWVGISYESDLHHCLSILRTGKSHTLTPVDASAEALEARLGGAS